MKSENEKVSILPIKIKFLPGIQKYGNYNSNTFPLGWQKTLKLITFMKLNQKDLLNQLWIYFNGIFLIGNPC